MPQRNWRQILLGTTTRDTIARLLFLIFSIILSYLVYLILRQFVFGPFLPTTHFLTEITVPLVIMTIVGVTGFILLDASGRDLVGRTLLLVFAVITSLVIVAIFLQTWLRALPAFVLNFFGVINLLGPVWDPTVTATYGITVFIAGTLWVTGLSLLIAIPLGLAGAIFLAEYSPYRLKEPLRLILILMAGIPSIVYGLWALYTLIPFLRNLISPLYLPVLDIASGSILWISMEWYSGFGVLPAGIVLAVMLLPTVVAVSYDAMIMVPDTLREASYALGASRTETSLKVVLMTALPGVGAAVLLSLGRAVGETMAVLLITGNNTTFPRWIFDQCYVMTSVIANQLGLAVGGYPVMESALFVVAVVLLLISVLFSFSAKLIVAWGMRKQGLQ
ncbi:MAG: phosphate ABC transporter permease subunit PstC [Promethearchaeota archaeon]